MGIGFSSCTAYLDRSEDSIVSADLFYKNFYNFQGFTEELYYCIPPMNCAYWQSDYNWGEDELIVAGSTWFMGYKIDNGDFWDGRKKMTVGEPVGWMARYNDEYKPYGKTYVAFDVVWHPVRRISDLAASQ